MSCLMFEDEAVAGLIPEESTTYSISGTTTLQSGVEVEFTAPSDGYISVVSPSSGTQVSVLLKAGGVTHAAVTARAWSSSAWDDASLYVRKGMKVYLYAEGSSGYYRFTSFV